MTIAAGFHCDDGLLLCADTQHTSSSKTHESKIFKIEQHGASLVLVLTGRTRFAQRGYERIKQEVEQLPSDKMSKGNIQDAIEKALRDVFNTHVYTHPDWGKADAPDFSFVVGLYSPIDGLSLMATEETVCVTMPLSVCLGSGSYIGDYLAKIYFEDKSSIIETVHIAIYTLYQAKSYDATSGGESQFIVLWKDGTSSPVRGFDVKQWEKFSDKFTRYVAFIFRCMADTSLSDTDVHARFGIFADELKRVRADLKEKGLLMAKVADDLGYQHYLSRVRKLPVK